MALSRLIMGAVDGKSAEMAIEQGAHSAMGDNRQIAAGMLCRDVLHRMHDPRLCVSGGFPSFETGFGVGKERVCGGLEKLWRQKPGCTSVVFAKSRVNGNRQITRFGQNVSRFARFCFGTAPDMRHRRHLI